jgi:glycosyltransferase involved in cell wall biosynthesis
MQHDNPLVSIIMPTYNRAGYISETIACIIAQTYTNWELLIIDDGSTDETETIVAKHADNRIKYYRFDRTGITGKLKNFGIRESKGELIAFMDSDDLWPVDKLEKQVAALLEHQEAGFSFTNGFNFVTDGSIDTIFYPKKSGQEIIKVFGPYCRGEVGIFIQSIMVWRSNISSAGFFKENRLFTDYSFIGNLCYNYKAIILFEPLFHRRLHIGNNFNNNSYEDYVEYFETIHSYIADNKLQLKDIKHALFLSHIRSGDLMILQKNNREGFKHYILAWKFKWNTTILLRRIVKNILKNIFCNQLI